MTDRYERECERHENKKEIENNDVSFAEKLRELYPQYIEFRYIEARMRDAGYSIQETHTGNDLKIWKEI